MSKGRIVFAGSPWPEGHAITTAAFSGRLDPAGVYLDLHVGTADYDADDEPSDDEDEDEDEDEDDDWKSKAVWCNYGACWLSSTKWAQRGVIAGTAKKPFDLAALDGATLRADAKPPAESDDRAFGIYLLGHDGVAKHVITFRRKRGGTWDIDWKAAIALEYTGATRFEHKLAATLTKVPFDGIRVPKGLADPESRFASCVADPKRWQVQRKRGERWFVRKR